MLWKQKGGIGFHSIDIICLVYIWQATLLFNHQELEAMTAAYEQAQARILEKDRERAELHKKSIDTEAQVILVL